MILGGIVLRITDNLLLIFDKMVIFICVSSDCIWFYIRLSLIEIIFGDYNSYEIMFGNIIRFTNNQIYNIRYLLYLILALN